MSNNGYMVSCSWRASIALRLVLPSTGVVSPTVGSPLARACPVMEHHFLVYRE